ncbi:hypothetical protein [Phyllobacterium myrsinacearum]|uniref:Uncharacterized protein n=1 Tax=Phyllobacterium myrsinacearum TaxID=28101 RepID=A0A839EGJ5_9HYPH|nr:hypothetical protein [Phyllobacterium myrsinacearum]MBA8877879.1 hypothetical protein [Phyllobacterium myrsinacearum]
MATSINTTRRTFFNLIPAVALLAVGTASASQAKASPLTLLIAEHWSIYSQLENLCPQADPNDPAYDPIAAEYFDGLCVREYRAREALLSYSVDSLEGIREKLGYMMRTDVGLHLMLAEDDVHLLLSSFA